LEGGLEGFFKGEKGLRQVDPLLHIFLMVMEVFPKLFSNAASHGKSKYHSQCSNVKLADDLIPKGIWSLE